MNIAIVEDEKKEAERLAQYVEKYSVEHEISLACQSFADGMAFFLAYQQQRFDIVFCNYSGTLF